MTNKTLEALALAEVALMDVFDYDNVKQALDAIREAKVELEKQEPFMCEPVPPVSEDGWTDWVCPTPRGYLMQCCDCGLIHEVDTRVAKYEPMPSEEFEVVDDPDMQCQWRMRRRDDLSNPVKQEPVAYLTEQQALEKLCNYINQNFKTQREAAKSFEVSNAYLSGVLNGKKRITEAMAHRLSLTRQRVFLEPTSLANGRAAPVRTKDLTDDEIWEIHFNPEGYQDFTAIARAVIAADREKNK